MAFPTTTVIDTFTYSNGALETVSGGVWQINPFNDAASNGVSVNANAARTTVTPGGVGMAWFDTNTYGANQEAYFTATTVGGYFGLYICLQQPSAGSATGDGYLVEIEGTNLSFYRFDNAVGTDIGSGPQTVTALANGDGFGALRFGSSIQAYRRSSGTWSTYGTPVTDATYTSGKLGFVIAEDTARPVIDNFGGGTVVTSRHMMMMGMGK